MKYGGRQGTFPPYIWRAVVFWPSVCVYRQKTPIFGLSFIGIFNMGFWPLNEVFRVSFIVIFARVFGRV